MFRKIAKIILALGGGGIGYSLVLLAMQAGLVKFESKLIQSIVYGVFMVGFALLSYLLAPSIIKKVLKNLDLLDTKIQKIPTGDIVIGSIGLLFALIISYFVSLPISLLSLPASLEFVKWIVTIAVYFVIVSIGVRIVLRNKAEIFQVFPLKLDKKAEKNKKKETSKFKIKGDRLQDDQSAKILDTSVLIDGRIKAIADTGFIEGKLVIPEFVLEELQFIADSADELKRERGRRGLDIVKDLQTSGKVSVEISNQDFPEIKEVDIKLLKLAQQSGAFVMTNDYNLNKLAVVQDIRVLNINDLANSVKTVVIPGEKMLVNIIKEGREKNQGLAYLEDGTMIVVEEGKTLIGQEVNVIVTTVLQTAAGKMIFAKPI